MPWVGRKLPASSCRFRAVLYLTGERLAQVTMLRTELEQMGARCADADDGRRAAEGAAARLEAQMQDLCTVAAAADAGRAKVSTGL